MPMECLSNVRRLSARTIAGLAVASVALSVPLAAAELPAPRAAGVNTNAPAVAAFSIQRFEVAGSTVFDGAFIQQTMREAIGPAVTLPQLRRALTRLQEAYRERGFTQVAVTLPRQSLTDGAVLVRVDEGPNASRPIQPENPALEEWKVPAYDLQHFEVRGNTALTAEELDRILGPLAGPKIREQQIQEALTRLRTAYLERGYSRVSVRVPEQLLTEGTVTIQIDEGRTLEAERSALALRTNSPVATPRVRTFEVRRYEVAGNTLLRPELVEQVFTNAVGTNVTLPQIQGALGALQLAYRERGFVTAAVSLPQQQLTNAVVKVQVTEGVLTDVRVAGNRYFSSNNVARALPSLATNAPLNGRVFQRELDLANQNRDRQIYPTIGPGPEPGTSALTLRVKDRLPLHGRLEVNNQSTPGTPDWRINASLQYANLWQREHQLGLSYGFTPEEFKSEGLMRDYIFNRPLVANYGAYYRLPFGSAVSVQEQIAQSGGRFGYDEATRQFRLPPAGTRPDLTAFVSASSSDTGTKLTDPKIVTQTPLLTIVSRDSGQNLSINEGAGARVSVPFALNDTRRLSLSTGFDLKRYFLKGFNTNNFLITTVITNAQGSQTIESRVSSAQPVQRQELNYLPLALGADYFQSDAGGSFSASLGLNVNLYGEGQEFTSPTNSIKDKIYFSKATLSLTRDQKVFKDWSLLIRGSGQVASGALINNEQFALGGLNSVRGYYEGDEYGDAGWFGSVELRTPFIARQVPIWAGSVPAWVRASIFLDGGQRFLVDAGPGPDATSSLLGAGFGFSANINNRFDLRVTVAWPLRDSGQTSANDPRAYFSLGGQF